MKARPDKLNNHPQEMNGHPGITIPHVRNKKTKKNHYKLKRYFDENDIKGLRVDLTEPFNEVMGRLTKYMIYGYREYGN